MRRVAVLAVALIGLSLLGAAIIREQRAADMPDVTGLSITAAVQRLAEVGLCPDEITYMAYPHTPLGTVIQQQPSADTRVHPGIQSVRLWVADSDARGGLDQGLCASV